MEKQLKDALVLIKSQLDDFEAKGLLQHSFMKTSDEAFGLISTTLDLKEAIDGAFFVQVYMTRCLLECSNKAREICIVF